MAIKTWITRSPKAFDTFYRYNTISREFVRIQLELGRSGSNPAPSLFAGRNRYVGFVDAETRKILQNRQVNRWTIHQPTGQIIYSMDHRLQLLLSMIPTNTETYMVDFSIEEGKSHPQFVHLGNAVTNTGLFPTGSSGQQITQPMLEMIAAYYIGTRANMAICNSGATQEELGNKLSRLYANVSTTSLSRH